MENLSKQVEEKIKGFKVTDKNMQCRGFQFELNTEYSEKGKIKACNNGFHFCGDLKDCFNYYSFDVENRVFEVEGYGDLDSEGDKSCSRNILFIRELSWLEVLSLVNTGKGNTGLGNAGYSNAGNDNAGAFNNLDKPNYIMFNKPSVWSYEDFVNSKACRLLSQVETTMWVPDYKMSDKEKELYPYFKTTEGYSKNIPYKEAFQNSWNNWSEDSKSEFKSLPNFDANVFFDITGVKI